MTPCCVLCFVLHTTAAGVRIMAALSTTPMRGFQLLTASISSLSTLSSAYFIPAGKGRAFRMSRGASVTPADDECQSATAGPLGGDWVGLMATFSPTDGRLVPVPDHLVPQSMLDWGDVPTYLETLTSEDLSSPGEETALQRVAMTVLPEVGCGVDNLEVTKKIESFSAQHSRFSAWGEPNTATCVASIEQRTEKSSAFEVIFEFEPKADDEESETHRRRLRIAITVEVDGDGSYSLSKLINMYVERLSTVQSTQGMAWSGPASNSGGLDARSVTQAIGRGIIGGDSFSVKRLKSGEDVWSIRVDELEGTWESEDGGEAVHRCKSYFDESCRLPQNVLVRFVPNDEHKTFELEVSIVESQDEGQTHVRRVVSFDSSERVFKFEAKKRRRDKDFD